MACEFFSCGLTGFGNTRGQLGIRSDSSHLVRNHHCARTGQHPVTTGSLLVKPFSLLRLADKT
jgi:hypothetical protein